MKTIRISAILMAGIMICASCGSKDDASTPTPTPSPTPVPENNLTDSIGTAERPQWTGIPSDWLDPTACQIVVVTQDELPVPVEDTDLLAAFMEDECRSVVSPRQEPNGKTAFTLTILPKADTQETGKDVELRYYSAHNKRIYIAQPFPFNPGETLGNLVTKGYQPILK